MMTDDITLSDDERAFESYLDSLSAALRHGSRERPFRDYCTGLLLPDGRKSVEPMAARLAPSSTRRGASPSMGSKGDRQDVLRVWASTGFHPASPGSAVIQMRHSLTGLQPGPCEPC
jgi:hypothetical protein